jgi:nicotinate-nucleotide adenylyltransferase
MKVGLFFGSFNPVHIGHVAIAQYMHGFTDLEQVWLVVSPQNPHKQQRGLLPFRQRLYMVQLAVEDFSYLRASDVESKLPVPSYTSYTLARLEEMYPEHQFALIMGSDNLEGFMGWRNAEAILERHAIYVYPRPGHPGGALAEHPSVHMTSAPHMDISATFLRQSLKERRDVSAFFPPKVWHYLDETGLLS